MRAPDKTLLLLILFSVASSAVAQLLLKIGMSHRGDEPAHAAGWPAVIGTALSNPFVVGGLALYALGALVWLLVLAKADLSFAYPFVGVGFILTLAMSRVVLDEVITMQRLFGTLLVAAGVVLVATGRA